MKIVEITSLGCMSCIVMNERIENVANKHRFDLKIVNSDLEDTSSYGTFDLFPVYILYNESNQEITRFEGEFKEKDLEAKLLGYFNA